MNFEQPIPIETSARRSRSRFFVWLRRRLWFVAFVIAPTLLAVIYYSLIAADIYSSEARFVIKSPDQKRPQLSTLANLIQTTGLSSGQEQANEILEYIRSRNALQALERDIHIRARFASPLADPISRFPQPISDSSFESLYKFYGKMVDSRLDNETGTAILTVKAFTPEDAYAINLKILDLSEAMVNRLNFRAQNRGIAEAQKQVDLATGRVRRARVALAQYRNSQELIDPGKQAVGVIEIANGLIVQRAVLQARLDAIQRATPDNPAIPALRQQVDAISIQIASQGNQVVGTGKGIASKLGGYENLVAEQEFATESLNVANAALVQARSEAQRQKFYLERVVDPNKPDMPLLPHRLWNIIVIAAACLCLYFIGWMLVVGILEHAPED